MLYYSSSYVPRCPWNNKSHRRGLRDFIQLVKIRVTRAFILKIQSDQSQQQKILIVRFDWSVWESIFAHPIPGYPSLYDTLCILFITTSIFLLGSSSGPRFCWESIVVFPRCVFTNRNVEKPVSCRTALFFLGNNKVEFWPHHSGRILGEYGHNRLGPNKKLG